MGTLEGKVAIITGAARGTGEVTARTFVDEGAKVLVTDVLDDLGAEVAAGLGEAAAYLHLDVSEPVDWEVAIAACNESFGPVDVLVNNAAILDVGPISTMDFDTLTRIVMVNQVGAYLGIQSVIPDMRERGGSIINVASIDANEGSNGVAAYTSSKWGMRGLTKAAAIELGMYGIRVNTMCPGVGSAEMSAPFHAEAMKRLSQRTERLPDRPVKPFNRPGEMLDAAKAIAWLASDDASFVTGTDLTVDGGFTAGKIEPGAPFS